MILYFFFNFGKFQYRNSRNSLYLLHGVVKIFFCEKTSPNGLCRFFIVCEQLTVTNFLFPSPSPAHQFITTEKFPLWEADGKKRRKSQQKRVIIIITCCCFWWENNGSLISLDFLIHPSIHSSALSGATTNIFSFTNTNSFLFLLKRAEKEAFR